MKKVLKAAGFLSLGIFLIVSAFSCSASGVSQQQYDTLKSQLDDANSQIAALKSQLAEATANLSQYDQLNQSYQTLKQQNDANTAQINTLQSQIQTLQSQVDTVNGEKANIQASYNDLQTRYQDLQQKYQELTAPGEPITENAVEQAIFDLVNQERAKHNLPLVSWGKNMYQLAKQNSKEMYEAGKYQYAMWNYFQQLFWAAGYDSVDSIAHGAILIWTNNQYQYEHGMISTAFTYCAIGAYQQGEVIYITLMMSNFP
jgi:uncharacterized protein YkwD